MASAGPEDETEIVFYDGHCGLCHGLVSFAVRRDRDGRFRFAPLGGARWLALLPDPARGELPDSVVVRRADGAILVRSAAVLHILRRLGGVWRLIAVIAAVVPRVLADGLYDGVARGRRRLFGKPVDLCPVVPADLRSRLLD